MFQNNKSMLDIIITSYKLIVLVAKISNFCKIYFNIII